MFWSGRSFRRARGGSGSVLNRWTLSSELKCGRRVCLCVCARSHSAHPPHRRPADGASDHAAGSWTSHHRHRSHCCECVRLIVVSVLGCEFEFGVGTYRVSYLNLFFPPDIVSPSSKQQHLLGLLLLYFIIIAINYCCYYCFPLQTAATGSLTRRAFTPPPGGWVNCVPPFELNHEWYESARVVDVCMCHLYLCCTSNKSYTLNPKLNPKQLCAQRRCYPTGRCAYRPSVTS